MLCLNEYKRVFIYLCCEIVVYVIDYVSLFYCVILGLMRINLVFRKDLVFSVVYGLVLSIKFFCIF